MKFELEQIDHIHIHVRDRAAAERWYREVLGFERMDELAFWAADGGPLTLKNGSGSIHLALFETPDSHTRRNSTIAFRVSAASLRASINHLSGEGIEVQPVDHQLSWSIYFRDPDGNPFEITTYEYDAFTPLSGVTSP